MKQVQEALPERENSKLVETFKQEVYSATQVTDALALEFEFYKKLAGDAEEQKELLGGRLEAAEVQLRVAMTLNSKYEEHARSGRSLSSWMVRSRNMA